jgi:hypothetical protein
MDFIRSGRLWTILNSPVKIYRTYGLYDFIRSGRLWTILNSPVKIYRTYGLYKAWQTLDNIEEPCKNLSDLWTL